MRTFKQHVVITEAGPTGAEYESIIAVGYNQGKPPYSSSKSKDSGSFSTAKKFLPKTRETKKYKELKPKEKLKVSLEKPYNDTAYKLGLAMRSMTTGKKMTQAGSEQPSTSSFWSELTGKGKDTSKTDVMTNDKISLKKKGGSQLMSGARAESIATLTAALEMSAENGDISDIVEKIKTGFNKVAIDGNKTAFEKKQGVFAKMDPKEYKEKAKKFFDITALHNELNDKLPIAFKNNPKIKESIVYIATTGYKKFPKGSDGIANRLIEFDPVKGIITHNIKTGPPSRMSSSMKSMASATSFYCAFKTSKKNPYSTLRTSTTNFEEYNPTLNGLIIETLMKDLNVDNQSLLNEGYAFFTEEKIIEGLLDKAKASLQKLGRSVKNWFKNIISKIIEGAKKVFDKVKGLGQKAFKVLFNFLGVEMSDAKVRISGIAGAFANK